MKPFFRGCASVMAAGFLLGACIDRSLAQSDPAGFPNKPVRIVVNVSPGGGVDTATRLVAKRLSERLGKPFVVENLPSGSGNIGAEKVFHADPDGYTLLSSSGSPLAINGWIYKKLNYDPAGFIPIAIMSRIPNVLVVRADLPVKGVAEFIAYAKQNPGKLTYGSQGTGTSSHLTAELFMSRTGTSLVHVPYRGSSPIVSDLIAGHLDSGFLPSSTVYELAEAGKVRILAVAAGERLSGMDKFPTLVESGYPDIVTGTWNAISAPPNTPDPVVRKLNAEIGAILDEPELRDRFKELQLVVAGGGLQETRAAIEKERKQWGDVVQAAGIQPE
jgi:tripartite-type tricarboxylate transporter receptor subunit TctC